MLKELGGDVEAAQYITALREETAALREETAVLKEEHAMLEALGAALEIMRRAQESWPYWPRWWRARFLVWREERRGAIAVCPVPVKPNRWNTKGVCRAEPRPDTGKCYRHSQPRVLRVPSQWRAMKARRKAEQDAERRARWAQMEAAAEPEENWREELKQESMRAAGLKAAGLDPRPACQLAREGIGASDVSKLSDGELYSLANIGPKSIRHIRAVFPYAATKVVA